MARNIIQVRRGYSSNYTGDLINDRPLNGVNAQKWLDNITLDEGEIGYEIDTGKFKIGKLKLSGNTWVKMGWGELPYAGGGELVPGSGIGIEYSDTSPDIIHSILIPEDNNVTIDEYNITGILPNATGTYYKLGLSDSLSGINDINISGNLNAGTINITGDLTVGGTGIKFEQSTVVLQTLTVTQSGNFGQYLTVSGIPVSVSGHQHTYTPGQGFIDIPNFCSGVADCVDTELVAGSGIQLSYADSPSKSLTIALSGVAANLHALADSGIVVKKSDNTFVGRSLSSGNNINILNANGVANNPIISLIPNVTGLESLTVDNLKIDGNTISSTNANGNIIIDPTGTGKVGINTSSPAYTLDVSGSGYFSDDLIVGGNLTVQGTSVVANVSTMEVEDPILTLGVASGNVITNDAYDRGLALKFANRTAFMGYDSGANEFVLLGSGVTSDNGNTYESGTYGDLHIKDLDAVNIDGSTITASTKFSGAGTDLTGTGANFTAGKAHNLSSGVAGSIPYQSGADSTSFLSIGTSGQFLRVNNGANAPYWDTVDYAELGNLPTIGDATLTFSVGGTGLTIGSDSAFTANSILAKTFSVSSNATPATGTGTIVARDTSGNFAANIITADLSGTATNALNIAADLANTGVHRLVFVSGTEVNRKPYVNSNLRFDAYSNILMGDDGTVPTTQIQYFIIDGGTP
jgi:hypothetical protein